MEHTNYAARLRYLDANQVSDAGIDYTGLTVVGPDNTKLGDLDGFIVDADAGRVHYAVVDTGGWFTSKQLLLPIGHTMLDSDGKALRADVNRDALGRYPEFDVSRFQQFTDDELRQFETRMGAACCPDDDVTAEGRWAHDSRRHYEQPSWWQQPATRSGVIVAGPSADAARIASERRDLDVPPAHRDRELEAARRERELVTARGVDETGRRVPDDVSPHFAGRAQPGDVLGIETGGERTHIGEDAEDENKRRREAERAARDVKE